MADSIPSREECIVFVRTLLDNAMSIGATKTGAERLGWLEDARFQSAILTALTAPVSERVPLEGHTATRWKVSVRQGYEVTLFFDNLDNMEAFLSLIGRKEEQHG